MNYQQIRQQLDAAVAAIEGLPDITHENEITAAVAGSPFTRTTLLPAKPNQLTVGPNGRDELYGLYQIDLYYPVGTGTSESSIAADSVVDAFPRTWQVAVGDELLRVKQSWVEGARVVNNFYTVAVMLEWHTIR